MSNLWCVFQTPSSLSPITSDPLVTLPLQGGFTHPQRRGMGVQEPTTNSNAHPPGTPSTSAGDSSMNHADVSGSHVPSSVPLSLSPLRLVRRRGKSMPDLVCSAGKMQPQPSVGCISICICCLNACCAALCCAELCCAVLICMLCCAVLCCAVLC